MYKAATEIQTSNKQNQVTLTNALTHLMEISSLEDNTLNEIFLQEYTALETAAGENTLTYRQAMKADDKDKFEEEMEKEMERFVTKESFEIKHYKEIPKGQHILNAVWTFKRKTTPSGQVYRHRSRLCVDGSRQEEGKDYNNTYSPVVNWTTIRLLFILSLIFDLKSRQVDYVQAFPQADLKEDVYMRIPAGFYFKDSDGNEEYVLKLKRNLYGLKQAAFNWNELLTSSLIKVGFKQSKSDPCLFLHKTLFA